MTPTKERPKILRKVRPVCEAGRFAGGMCANEVRARARVNTTGGS